MRVIRRRSATHGGGLVVLVIPRREWTAVRRPSTLGLLGAGEVRGVAVHWTGSTTPVGDTVTMARSVRMLADELAFHTRKPPAGRGWSDIAYNFAVDQSGRVFELRGHGYRSAANGNQTVNRSHAAVTFLIGQGDTPSEAAVDAFVAWRTEVWLERWPRATAVVGHRDLSSTDCPGPALHQLVKSGRLAALEEDQMALSDEDVERVARRTAELIMGGDAVHPVVVAPGMGEWQLPDGRAVATVPTVLRRILDAVTQR